MSAAGSIFDRDGDGVFNEAEANAKVSAELAFKKIDTDGSGSIDAEELSALLDDLGEVLSEEDLDKALKDLDRDGSGRIEMGEFVEWFFDLRNGDSGGDESSWRKALRRGAKKARQRMGTDIHKVAWEGNIEVVRIFLETNKGLVNARDTNDHGDDFRPLHYAAYQGHTKLCKYLLSQGADIDAVTASGCTALFFASQQGRSKVVKLLLKQRASASISENECGLGPLDVASNDKIRTLFRTVGGYGRPGRVAPPHAELVPSSKNRINSATPSKMKQNMITIKLTWDAVEPSRSKDELPVSGYVVRIKDQVNDKEVRPIVDIVANEGAGPQSARIGMLPEGVPMIVQIAAVNGLGRGKYSEPSNLVAAARRPGKMKPPMILEEDTMPNSVTVTWVDSAENLGPDVTAVEVQYRRICDSEEYAKSAPRNSTTIPTGGNERVHLPGDEFCPLFRGKVAKQTVCTCKTSEAFKTGCAVGASSGIHMASVKGLLSGSVYEFRVRAKNVAGVGEASETAMAETDTHSRKSNTSRSTARVSNKQSPVAPRSRSPIEPFTPEGKEETFRGRRGRFKVNHIGKDDF